MSNTATKLPRNRVSFPPRLGPEIATPELREVIGWTKSGRALDRTGRRARNAGTREQSAISEAAKVQPDLGVGKSGTVDKSGAGAAAERRRPAGRAARQGQDGDKKVEEENGRQEQKGRASSEWTDDGMRRKKRSGDCEAVSERRR